MSYHVKTKLCNFTFLQNLANKNFAHFAVKFAPTITTKKGAMKISLLLNKLLYKLKSIPDLSFLIVSICLSKLQGFPCE